MRLVVAEELVVIAKVISGKEGRAIGLGSRLSSDPDADAMTIAREIASGLFAAEHQTIHQLIGSPNQVEAVMSHFVKREPKFVNPR
jgi:hypothetical protein